MTNYPENRIFILKDAPNTGTDFAEYPANQIQYSAGYLI
jgi:hypothetical protein